MGRMDPLKPSAAGETRLCPSPEYLAASGYRGAAHYVDEAAVTDRAIITAGAVFPADFARHIARRLELYVEPVEAAWYGLIKTGDRKFFFDLLKLTSGKTA